MAFLVDRLHIKGHSEACCQSAGDAERYHPDLPKFAEIKTANRECAEQAFAWLGKVKNSLNNMAMGRFNFMLFTIVEERNNWMEKKLCY